MKLKTALENGKMAREVELTDEGKEFYKYIKQAMEYIQNAESKFTDLINLETGTIKIGISTTLTKEFLLPFIEIFHSKYPNINIEINILLFINPPNILFHLYF